MFLKNKEKKNKLFNKIYRIIDVNINRSRESLRVLEDIARFYFKDEILMQEIRNLRHSLQKFEVKYLLKNFIFYREAAEDIGKSAQPVQKLTVLDLMKANFKRLEESSRVLEEFINLVLPAQACFFQNIRFKVYELEKKFLQNNNKRFPGGIYLITDDNLPVNKIIKIVNIALKKGIKIVQLRDKKRNVKEIIKYGKQIAQKCKIFNALFLVNDRIDIALELNADGIHLGSNDISPCLIQKIAPHLIIGLSVDTLAEAKNIFKNKIPVDYLALGPIFKTKTKKDVPVPRGLKMLKDLVKISPLPVVAIGGINENNFLEVLKTKVNNIALISAISKSKNINKTLNNLIALQQKF